MSAPDWARLKTLFADAMERPPAERAAYVAALPESDAPLREELASLLAAAEGSSSFDGARAGIARAAGVAASTTLQSLVGAALGQQYEIVRMLGQGGMGAVFLAREHALERFVAVKVLRPHLAHAEQSRERFRREARIVAQLSHPSILPLHTFGEVGGTWYFVMGYVRGTTLEERLRVEGRLPAHDAMRIVAELAEALVCAHRGGVIHRDIKPSNILLDSESGRAVLADFGISKVQSASERLTMTGLVMGTPHYMSPEQARGDDVDARSDIYALGAVAYAMLAGREPYAELDGEALRARREAHDPAPLASVAPAVPPDLSSIVMQCLSRDPALRWPTAQALRDALARAAGEQRDLPEAVRGLPMFGPYALIWTAIWTGLALRPGHSAGDRALLLLIALIVPVGLLTQLWTMAPEGIPRRELARIAFWPPEWWGMWWPHALRRPHDLWRRLPWPARASRMLLSAFIVTLPTLILAREWVEAASGAPRDAVHDAFARLEWGLVWFTGAGLALALVWGLARRLSPVNAVRMVVGTTMPSKGWEEPAVARLLAPRAGERLPNPDSPVEHVRAIDALLGRSSDVLDEQLRTAASAEAHALLRAIEALDTELGELTADADTAEMDRLSAQIASIESGLERAERRELAELLHRELDLRRRIRLRCELVAQERARTLGVLRGLYRHVCGAYDGGSVAAAGHLRQLLSAAGTPPT